MGASEIAPPAPLQLFAGQLRNQNVLSFTGVEGLATDCQVRIVKRDSTAMGMVGVLLPRLDDGWWPVRFPDGTDREYLPSHLEKVMPTIVEGTDSRASDLAPHLIDIPPTVLQLQAQQSSATPPALMAQLEEPPVTPRFSMDPVSLQHS